MIRCWHGKFGDVAVLAVVDDAIVVSCHDVFIDELVKFVGPIEALADLVPVDEP